MPSRLSDTPPEIEEILIEGYRRMTPAERLLRAFDMSKAVQQLALARIRAQWWPYMHGPPVAAWV